MGRNRKISTEGLFLLRKADYPDTQNACDVRGLRVPVTTERTEDIEYIDVPALDSSLAELTFYLWRFEGDSLRKRNYSIHQRISDLATRQLKTDRQNAKRATMGKVVPIEEQIAEAIRLKDWALADMLMAQAKAESGVN